MRKFETIRVRSRINSRITIILFLILNGVSMSVLAQDTVFWFVAPQLDDSGNAGKRNRPVYFMITAKDEPATVTMDMPAFAGFNQRVISLSPGESKRIIFGADDGDFSDAQMDTVQNDIRTPGIAGVKHNRGIRFKSTAPVSIYYQVDATASKDMFVLKGAKALGIEFYTPFQDLFSQSTNHPYAYPQFHIVATEDNTAVEITPAADIAGTTAGATISVTLHRGETFAARADAFQQTARLAGSHIVADKPVAVTVAEDLLLVGAGPADVAGDQIVPVDNLGTSYAVIRGFSSSNTNYCDKIFILATRNGTSVDINGSNVATLNAGLHHMHSMPVDTTAVITANHPVYVYQLSGYGNANGTEVGAALLPSMNSISSKRISFYKDSNAYNQNIFVLVRSGNEGDFTVNGSATVLEAGDFKDIPNMAGWKYARKNISSVAAGTVVMNNSAGAFALGYFYTGQSTGNSCSFGYLSEYGNLSFPDTTYKCPGTSVTLDGGYADSHEWTLPDGSTLYTPTVTATTTGRYTVTVNQALYTLTASTVVRDYAQLSGGTIEAGQTVCYGTTPAPLNSLTAATGGAGTISYEWEYSTDNGTWTAMENSSSAAYTPTETLAATTFYRRKATDNFCTAYSDTVTVTVLPRSLLDYPDIRLRVCPATGATVNLSKYIDSTEVTDILWNGIAPAIPVTSPAGSISTDNLASPGVYTLTYTVKNRCIPLGVTRKAYLEVIRNGNARRSRDTVEICYTQAEAVNINQIFGIEAGGTWTFPPAVASYITQSTSPTYGGAVIMNGKRIYEETLIRNVEIIYTPAAGSCLDGKTYRKVIRLYEL